MQRPLNSSSPLHPRNGAPKKIAQPEPVIGHKRVTAPSHLFKHGAPLPLDDEKEPPLRNYEQKIPLHPATPPRIAAQVHPVANDPTAILREAATLGPKVKS